MNVTEKSKTATLLYQPWAVKKDGVTTPAGHTFHVSMDARVAYIAHWFDESLADVVSKRWEEGQPHPDGKPTLVDVPYALYEIIKRVPYGCREDMEMRRHVRPPSRECSTHIEERLEALTAEVRARPKGITREIAAAYCYMMSLPPAEQECANILGCADIVLDALNDFANEE
jgi:hypothetical protein